MSTTIFATLESEVCCVCSAIFGLESSFKSKLRQNHEGFYCPNGHRQYYLAETEAERLKREVAQLQTSIEHKDARISTLHEERAALERSRAALKGVHTRTCNRVKHGVCPCCNRTFANLANHMETQHPKFNG